MQLKIPDLKHHEQHALAFAVYLLISLVMFWNITGSISSKVVNGGGDVYQSMWGLWWVPYSVFTLHQSPYLTSYLFYPLGANLVSQTMSPLAGIITAPVQALAGIAATYNLLFFLSFALGGLFTFMLSRYLVKNDYAAFIAGLVFAFSPMHIAQSYSHLQWTTIEFIPLFVFCFLLMLREKKTKYAIYAAIAFVLLTFAGDIEQGIMMVAFAIISLVILLFLDRKEILNKRSIMNIAVLGAAVLVISSPFLISIYTNLGSSLSSASQLSDVAHNMLYSDNLASFFLPSYFNGIFHNATLGYVASVYGTTYKGVTYSPDITEKVSYIGYSVLLLAALALYHEHKKNKMRDIAYWIVIGAVFLLLALGPNLQIGGAATGVPTLYSAYRAIPGFNLVREPGRFDVVITLALAVLAAIGFDHLSKSKYNLGGGLVLASIFTVLILIEYNGMPLSAAFANTLTVNAQIPAGYHGLRSLAANLSVLELPALPNFTTGSFLYPGKAMYYQTSFMKPILGGYTTRTNSSQQQLLQNVPLAVSAGYLQSGEGLIFPYPITEDYSNLTLFWLAAYNVGAVSVINNAYTPAELASLQSYLYTLFGNPVDINANVTIYASGSIESLVGARSMVSYISGTWLPGYEFCSSTVSCSQAFASAWWGANPRAITIFSPNATKATISFQAEEYNSAAKLEIFLNTNNVPIATFNLTRSLSNYSATVDIPGGLSQVTFYQPTAYSSTYLNFGIDNITIAK